MANGQRMENVFSTRSHVFHARKLKPYQKYFTTPNILKKEHLVNETVLSFCKQLETRFVNKVETAPLADWIEYCKDKQLR